MFRTGLMSLGLTLILMQAILCFASSDKPPNPWLEIHSSHFTVITDAGDKKGREIALRFEQMRSVFAGLLTKNHLNQPVPLTILAFNNDKMYYQLAPLHQGQPIEVPGFLLPGEDQDFIALNLVEAESWRAVAYDFAHMLLVNNYPPVQGWFDDGMAEYFSSIRVDDKEVEIGGDPELIGGNPEVSGDARGATSMTKMLSTQPWIPIADLFAMKHDASRANGGVPATKYYAESWMVIHYLLHQKLLPETGSYFDLVLNQHVPIEEAIQKAYGMPPAQLEEVVKSYFQSLSALQTEVANAQQKNSAMPQPYQYPALVTADSSTITSNSIPEGDAGAIYAGVQIRIPEHRQIGLQQLKTLATTPTPAEIRAQTRYQAKEKEKKSQAGEPNTLPTTAMGDELAHRILAGDHIEHGQFDDALAELGNAAALDQSDMWVRYYLCLLKYRMAEASNGDIRGLANMLIDLRAVLEWYPEMASAYDLLGVARNQGGTTLAAMQAERAAITLSPRNQTYVYHLAQIYISAKKWEAAQALLERLKTGGDAQLAKLAQDRLDEIGNERKYGLTASSAGSQPQFEPQKSPFDVLDEDAAKRAAAEKQQEDRGADQRPTKFLKGRLIAVDCSAAPAAVLTVSGEGVVLKLRAADYKSLLLIGADSFSCDWRDRQVTVNYKLGGMSDGDLISLEVK